MDNAILYFFIPSGTVVIMVVVQPGVALSEFQEMYTLFRIINRISKAPLFVRAIMATFGLDHKILLAQICTTI